MSLKADPQSVIDERFPKGDPEGGPPEESSQPGKKRGPYKKTGKYAKRAPAPPPVPRSKEEEAEAAKLCSFLVATLTDIALPLVKHRTLTDDEAKLVGGALEPVLNKYLPDMAGWALEINLLVVCAMLWQATTPVKKETNSSEPGENRLQLSE